MEKINSIKWEAADHIKADKNSDWFWIVGIISFGIIILALFFNNILFALIILLGTLASFISAKSSPRIIEFELNRKGVRIHDTFYGYGSLESYYVIDEDGYERDRIIIKSSKLFMPHIIMPLSPEIDQEDVREFLIEYLNEEEMEESTVYKIMTNLGF